MCSVVPAHRKAGQETGLAEKELIKKVGFWLEQYLGLLYDAATYAYVVSCSPVGMRVECLGHFSQHSHLLSKCRLILSVKSRKHQHMFSFRVFLASF